jgi:selenocysteine lyase/cysteine desulfurase
MDVEDFRRLMPVVERYAYLNHSSTAPLALPVQRAVAESARLQEDGSEGSAPLKERIGKLKGRIAGLIGAEVDEVALRRNTTEGLNTVASGLDWREGDNVITDDLEFPANVYPWLNLEARYGVETRIVPARDGRVLADDLSGACDERTRVITVSFVQFFNGYRADLERLGKLCRERGIYLCVDAIQGLGPVELNVRRCRIDFLAAAAHKWLLGPMGIGFLYVRRELQDSLWPAHISHFGVAPRSDRLLDYELRFKPTAEKFEGGLPNYAGIFGLETSMGLLDEVGLAAIRTRTLELTDHLCTELPRRGYRLLSHRGPGEKSGTVTFVSDREASEAIFARLSQAGVIVSLREGAIRVAPYFYNTEAEIERLLGALGRQ